MTVTNFALVLKTSSKIFEKQGRNSEVFRKNSFSNLFNERLRVSNVFDQISFFITPLKILQHYFKIVRGCV